jgi:hypothetical protein
VGSSGEQGVGRAVGSSGAVVTVGQVKQSRVEAESLCSGGIV